MFRVKKAFRFDVILLTFILATGKGKINSMDAMPVADSHRRKLDMTDTAIAAKIQRKK